MPVIALLGLLFITLKLTGVIAWSWLWVLAPFWGPLALALVAAVVITFSTAIREAVAQAKRARK